MTFPKLIGLTGLAGTGKDTVRQILESEHGYHGLAFADPIRAMVQALFERSGIDLAYMTDRARKEVSIPELGASYRQLVQTLGTEWGRGIRSDFWVSSAKAYITSMTSKHAQFVLSDVRFLNEADMITRMGGQIWRVQRDSAEPVRPHISEQTVALIHAPIMIHNNGSIDDLRTTVNDVLWGLK